MITEIIVKENQSVRVSEDLSEQLLKAKIVDQTLPYSIKDNSLVFDNYIVGSIQIDTYIIKILPRNSAFDLSTFFEMSIYTDFDFLNEDEISNFGFSAGFGIDVLIQKFINQVRRLCVFGLTGSYKNEYVEEYTIYGKVDLSSYYKKTMPCYGIRSLKTQYALNIVQNMILKSALVKCLRNSQDSLVRTEIALLLKNFVSVDAYNGRLEQDIKRIKNFYSANTAYPLCIEMAITILQDLKLTYLDSTLSFKSFLLNSNDIFEKYIRTILKRNLDLSVSKVTDESIEIANINRSVHKNEEVFKKYLSPDIVLNYDRQTQRASAVLDVKNKGFNPSSDGIYSDLISSADLYQIIVYCLRLKTNIAALIYPTDQSHDPITFFAEINETISIYLLSMNMKDSLSQRHMKIISEINKYLLPSL